MAKIVYNACYGGFGLSEAAVRRYAALKGLTLFPEKDAFGLTTYWVCPPDQRAGVLDVDAFHRASMEARQTSNTRYDELTLCARKISRSDPILVQVVEELGDAASGGYAKLRIAEVPSGGRYRIDEYDGFESVETPESYQWETAP